MKEIEVKSRVGPDGVLNLRLPIGKSEANREVKVTVQPAEVHDEREKRQEWRRFVKATAGSISDATFKRHEQGRLEERGDLFP